MKIYPAIDILDGKCVRLMKGSYDDVTEYALDPFKVAESFVAQGIDFLHIVDLDGAREGKPVNVEKIVDIAALCRVQIGGGIRSEKDIGRYLDAGVDRLILGTVALEDPDLLAASIVKYGASRFVISVDVDQGKVMTRGWLKDGGEDLQEVLEGLKKIGVEKLIVTDISRDGTLKGINGQLFDPLLGMGFEVIAAGGVGSKKDLELLKTDGVIIGKALYEGKIDLSELNLNTLAKRIVPCMDIDAGRVVKGTYFKNLRDAGDPVELAKAYSEAGADELVFLDVTATVEKRKTLVNLVKRISKVINIPFTVGGGIKSIEHIEVLLRAGADKVSLGSVSFTDPDLVKGACLRFGAQCIVISLDCKKTDGGWNVYVNGGRKDTGRDVIEFACEMQDLGVGELLVNSLDRDGTREGYDLPLLRALSREVNVPIIASSGAGCKRDFLDALRFVDAALAASLFHFGELEIGDLKKYLLSNNLTVRI